MRNQKGFTLLEVVLVLMIIALLIGMMMPVVWSQIEDARQVSAQENLRGIKGAILDFYNDLGFWPKYVDGHEAPDTAAGTYNILRSEKGEVPASLDPKWLETSKADYIENHLIKNGPGYREKPNPQVQYGWNGPYLTCSLRPDPWGNKWFVNVEFLDETGKPSEKHRVWIISAGPNKNIETSYEQLQTLGQLGGDDVGLAIIH